MGRPSLHRSRDARSGRRTQRRLRRWRFGFVVPALLATATCARARTQSASIELMHTRDARAVVVALQVLPLDEICGGSRGCPTVVVDTVIYSTDRPVLAPGTDSVAFILPTSALAPLRETVRRWIGGAWIGNRETPKDTAVISLGFYRGSVQTRRGAIEVIAQVFAQTEPYGRWIHVQLIANGQTWRVESVWTVEG